MTPETAAQAWGARDPVLLSHRENAVYAVDLNGKKAALRLHRPGYMSPAAIRSELWWMEELAIHDFPCPAPLPLPDGDLVLAEGDAMATMISWVEGAPIGEGGVPLPGTLPEQCRLMQNIGGTLADMHDISDHLSLPPGFERPRWDLEGFLGDTPTWGPYWDNPSLSPTQRAQILEGRDIARALLTDAQLDQGLIHADLLRENTFNGSKGLTVIDFDDAGVGFRLYDITTVLTQSLEDAELAHLAHALIEGYTTLRPLSDKDIALLPVASLLRSLAALGWVIPRYPPDHPKMPLYIARATRSIEAIKAGRNFLLEGF